MGDSIFKFEGDHIFYIDTIREHQMLCEDAIVFDSQWYFISWSNYFLQLETFDSFSSEMGCFQCLGNVFQSGKYFFVDIILESTL